MDEDHDAAGIAADTGRGRAPHRAVLAGAALLLLTACVLPPDDPPRETALPVSSLGLSARPAPLVADAWWQAYGDAQLTRLMEQTLAGNPTLDQALARLRAAQSAAAGLGAGLLPHLGLDATEVRQRFSANDVYPPPFAGNVYWQGALKGDLSWNLDFWGRQASLVDQAAAKAEAVGLDLAAARLALTGAVAQSYLDLTRAYALADLADRTQAQRQRILDITGQRIASGLDTEMERHLADAAVSQARIDAEAIKADQARAVHQLAALAGAGAEAYPQIQRPTLKADAVLPLPAALPADLLARRPDVAAAGQRIKAALSGREAAHAAFYPDVNLMAFTGLSAIGFATLFEGSSLAVGAGPAIHLPLFDAGELAAQFKGATAGLDDAVADYNHLVLQAVQEVASALSDLAALKQERGYQQRHLADAEIAYNLAEARYRAGLTNYLSVLNAETQLLLARQQDIDLATAEVMTRIKLHLAVGGNFHPSAGVVTADKGP